MAGGTVCWLLDPHPDERRFITLLARLNPRGPDFYDFNILPNIDRKKRFAIKCDDEWLKRGRPLQKLSDLLDVVEQVRKSRER